METTRYMLFTRLLTYNEVNAICAPAMVSINPKIAEDVSNARRSALIYSSLLLTTHINLTIMHNKRSMARYSRTLIVRAHDFELGAISDEDRKSTRLNSSHL